MWLQRRQGQEEFLGEFFVEGPGPQAPPPPPPPPPPPTQIPENSHIYIYIYIWNVKAVKDIEFMSFHNLTKAVPFSLLDQVRYAVLIPITNIGLRLVLMSQCLRLLRQTRGTGIPSTPSTWNQQASHPQLLGQEHWHTLRQC